MRIALFGNIFRSSIHSHIEVLIDYLNQHDITVVVDKEFHDFVGSQNKYRIKNAEIIENDNFNADFAFSIGGDGTFLNTAAHVGKKQIPILGINTGRLGFLADVPSEGIIPALEAIFQKEFNLEERSLLQVETSDNATIDYPYVLNEIAVLKQDSSSMISIHAGVNGEIIHTYQADGLIVSTPTGSTAYSMSVGGPLVAPQSQNIILSPVASHSLNVRPLIIPDSWKIELEIISRSQCYLLALDGRSKILEQGTKLKIKKADFSIQIVKQLNHTFFDTLKNKLMWGADKRN